MIVGEKMLSTQGLKLVNYCSHFVHFRLFPSTCVLCGARGHNGLDLCKGCQSDLARIPSPCPACGMPLTESEHSLCGHCLQKPAPLQRTISPFYYQAPLAQLVTEFKFNHQLKMARLFAALLATELANRRRPECIIPVPLHRRRLQERGFNQSLEIARLLGKQLNIPVDFRLCQRTRYTAPQTGLDAKQRRQNIKNAFALTAACPYRHIAIIDDVITTANTVTELARVLRKHGVEEIEVWSVARAVPD